MKKSKLLLLLIATTCFSGNLTSCSSPTKEARKDEKTLKVSSLLVEEQQSEKALSQFCDATYIALQSTQEVTGLEVIERYDAIKSLRTSWKNNASINELTQASIISSMSADNVANLFEEMLAKFPSSFPEEVVAELTKTAIVSKKSPTEVSSIFKEVKSIRKWGSIVAITEMTKAAIFGQKKVTEVQTRFNEFESIQGKAAKEMELVELTKATLLSGKTTHEIVKAFDQIWTRNQGFVNRIRVAELTRIAVMTGASPKMVFYRFAEITMKKGESYSTPKILELTKYSLLSRKSANELIEIFDRTTKSQNMSFSLFSGEILQDSTFGNQVDECNGGHARLMLSVDTYRGG